MKKVSSVRAGDRAASTPSSSVAGTEYALITGASSGIGRELARLMVEDGQNVFLVARRAAILRQLKLKWEARYEARVDYLALDLCTTGQASALHAHCRKRNVVVGYLINNAGAGDFGEVHVAKLETYASLLRLNVIALTELTCLFANDMRARGRGRILNISSLAAFQPCPNLAVYGASKSYIMTFTEALNFELRGTGVTATVVCPGVTQTAFLRRTGMESAQLAKGKRMAARDVATVAYRAMMRGQLNVVPGWRNKVVSLGSRVMACRELLLRLSAFALRRSP